MEEAILYTTIKAAIPILIFVILALTANRLLLSLEKRGTISPSVKKRVFAALVTILGLFAALLAVYELSYHPVFLYLFLVVFAVSTASMYPILNSFYAHYALVNTRQLSSGAYVSVGRLRGRLKSVGYVFTQLLLDDGSSIFLPNVYLLKKPFRVYRQLGRMRARVTLPIQSPLDVESLATKIEEGIRKNFKHLTSDSEVSVCIEKVSESAVSFLVEAEYVSSEVRRKVLNNFIESLFVTLYEYSPSIEVLKS